MFITWFVVKNLEATSMRQSYLGYEKPLERLELKNINFEMRNISCKNFSIEKYFAPSEISNRVNSNFLGRQYKMLNQNTSELFNLQVGLDVRKFPALHSLHIIFLDYKTAFFQQIENYGRS